MKSFEKTLEDVKKLSGSKLERGESLASKLVFMHDELEKLQVKLAEDGWTEVYQNGPNQMMIKKSTSGDVYNTLMKSYLSTMKILNEMLDNIPAGDSKIEKFLNDRA